MGLGVYLIYQCFRVLATSPVRIATSPPNVFVSPQPLSLSYGRATVTLFSRYFLLEGVGCLIGISLLKKMIQATQPSRSLARTVVLAASMAFSLTISDDGLANNTSPEYAVKAAYIFNILRFAEAADNSLFSDTDEIRVCLLGDNKFGQYITPIASKVIKDKPLSIVNKDSLDQTRDCHLVFVGDSNRYSAKKVSKVLADKKIIVVGDNIDFVKNGGMFAFYIKNKKVRLGLNKSTLNRSGIKISSLLLEVSTSFGDDQ